MAEMVLLRYITQPSPSFVVPDFEWKTNLKTKTHPNTKFLPIFQLVGTKIFGKTWKN